MKPLPIIDTPIENLRVRRNIPRFYAMSTDGRNWRFVARRVAALVVNTAVGLTIIFCAYVLLGTFAMEVAR